MSNFAFLKPDLRRRHGKTLIRGGKIRFSGGVRIVWSPGRSGIRSGMGKKITILVLNVENVSHRQTRISSIT